MTDIPLGKDVTYPDQYSADVLFPISRQQSRDNLGFESTALPFQGGDIWNAYEVSWLNDKGLPQVACARFHFPCESVSIVESKSFKLYLNSFNQTRFSSWETVGETLVADLSACVGAPIEIDLYTINDGASRIGFSTLPGFCLDTLDITVDRYDPNPAQLTLLNSFVTDEHLNSNLLRSLCPVTAQPDWGSVHIVYSGPEIDKADLLKYLIGYRQHQEFHEQCVERIFRDITAHCAPDKLYVHAFYTRRGGLDINPYRSSAESEPALYRLFRQ